MSAQLSSANLAAQVIAHRDRSSRIYWRELAKSAGRPKAITNDPEEKNRLWFIGAFIDGTGLYLEAYRQLRRGHYLDGWCTLEQAELAFARQEDNPFVPELLPYVKQRANLIALWQSTFPYRHFISPGMILKRWACSICGKQSTPVEPCGHTPNRVYAGEFCFRKILEFEPQEMSIVTDPVQKYSVLQLDYDYSVVRYVLDHLAGPFDEWDGEWTHKRQSHKHFEDRPHEGPCPCGSKLHYSECCLPTDGVRLPHFQIRVAHRTSGVAEDRIVLRSKRDVT
ncbi:SEC-C domain-containing protein [Mesorhizobium sp. C416B]|uniref:SEC-C domain-containing protein n=1 Tax=unclassified Mesorhizobium TaxID=325217 RepID=UPI0003CF3E41|nr:MULTISPECIES: SEC-C domain-containing protein [unclassified Mesorhizobium]ESX45403.1 hypothetical protein X762_26005 [Mesorhizobium sp. LSHC426A00]ESX50560.1 hypothetical protein X761_25975 [Mesorhizobium sp. LSHC424B00]ESX66020.1 hypothetical protein X758_28405 [Mesorhizobium sp. LSHC416B00]WJI62599.1 SEC-C domain-containing protein [Mesorhizobium sp. C416B]